MSRIPDCIEKVNRKGVFESKNEEYGALFDSSVDREQTERSDNIPAILPVMERIGRKLEEEQAEDIARSKAWNIELTELYTLAKKIDESIISDGVLERIGDCANILEYCIDAAGRKKLFRVNFCKNRFCPVCNRRRSKKLFGQVYRVARKILERDSKSRFIFVTFTQKNCKSDELKSELDGMNKAFSYLVGKNKTFSPAKKLKENLLGYMKAVEVTYNSDTDTYHPHIHALFSVKASYFSRGYIKQADWRSLWADAMGLDYMPMVCVETVEQLPKAVAEVGKYPVKLDSILRFSNRRKKVKALMVLHKALKNRRMLTFGGNFKEFMRAEENVDSPNVDLINVGGEEENDVFVPIARIFAKYDIKIGAYIC